MNLNLIPEMSAALRELRNEIFKARMLPFSFADERFPSLVRDLAQSGKAVIVISSELSELLTACDRILVMADGRAHQMLDRAELDDPAETNPEHALQAAERRLQVEIQKALSIKEASHG